MREIGELPMSPVTRLQEEEVQKAYFIVQWLVKVSVGVLFSEELEQS